MGSDTPSGEELAVSEPRAAAGELTAALREGAAGAAARVRFTPRFSLGLTQVLCSTSSEAAAEAF